MTITATAASAAAHTITYSGTRPDTGSAALSPAIAPLPGAYTIRASSGTDGLVRIQLSINHDPVPARTLPSTIPAVVDPLGPVSASQTSYRPALRRARPAMRYPA